MSNVIPLRNTGGFTRMDNDLYEALIGADLSGRELRVALAIHRFTTGYNVDTARIPAATIASLSGIARENVSRIIGELIRQRVVFRSGGSKAPIGLAPFAEWKIDPKNEEKKTKAKTTQSVIPDTSLVSFPTHIKDSKNNLGSKEPVGAVAPTAPEQAAEAPEQPQAPVQPKAERIPYEKIKAIYNSVCGEILPECLKLNKKRSSNIAKLWNMKIGDSLPFRKAEFWEGYFHDCLKNKHWTGRSDSVWFADIEFLTRESSVLRVLEAK